MELLSQIPAVFVAIFLLCFVAYSIGRMFGLGIRESLKNTKKEDESSFVLKSVKN